MGKEKVSLITTVLNEENSIDQFLASIANLSLKPDEVIMVDGGSTDNTTWKVQSSKFKVQNLRIIVQKGANRSEGRNFAIQEAKNEIIAIADVGCELDEDWLLEITKPFNSKEVDVVAGYYQAKPETIFQKCVAPFVLVMPDRVDPKNFLPSSRSMAIKKSIWQKFDGFPEEYSDNEDFVFANKLKNGKAKIVFAGNAIVFWHPRKNLKEFWSMIYRFARGDAKAGLRRFKVASVFLRYVFFVLLCLSSVIFYSLIKTAALLAFTYLGWSVWKNYRYIKNWQAVFILPILQIISDMAVIFGSIEGGLNSG